MANYEELNYGYLGDLTNAHHDAITQQIDSAAQAYVTENELFVAKRTALHQCRLTEDEVWLKSQVDPVVKLLAAADKRQDNYMSCFHSIVHGYAMLPDDEEKKAQAQEVLQVFKDFNFSTTDSYGAEADKIQQMQQNLAPYADYLTGIGAQQWFVKAYKAAGKVLEYLAERAKTKGEMVKGEMKEARRQTDLAVADLYKTINAMMVLMPTDELTALYTQLKGFERYARQYWLSKDKDSEEPDPDPEPEESETKE